MRAVWDMAKKDLRLLLRDRAGFFFVLFLPLIYATFFGVIFSGQSDETQALRILLVDQDQSESSRGFIQRLQDGSEIEVEMSDDREEAREAVRRGARVAFVTLLPGFGEARKNVFSGPPPKAELGVDPARKAEAGMLVGILTKYAAEDMQRALSDPQRLQDQMDSALQEAENAPPQLRESLERLYGEIDNLNRMGSADQASSEGFSGFQPLEIESVPVTIERSGPPNAFSLSFPQGIVWGLLSCAASFSLSLVVERRAGTLIRMQVAPVGRLQILAGKALACFLTIVCTVAMILILGRLGFGVSPSSVLMMAMVVLSVAVCFVGIMLLLSVLGKTERAAAGIGWSIMLVMAMLGGGMIPLFVMPGWMQTVSSISPVKWSILAMEGVLWRQFTASEMILPCSILTTVGVVCFVIGVRSFRWSD